MTTGQTTDGDELVVACTLDRAGHEQQSRRWTELRRAAELGRLETPQGKRVYFRADEGVLEELAQLVEVENECCSWAQWRVEPLQSEIVLHVTSTGHGTAVIHGMFDRPLEEAQPASCSDCA
jgi:hypothetical protein